MTGIRSPIQAGVDGFDPQRHFHGSTRTGSNDSPGAASPGSAAGRKFKLRRTVTDFSQVSIPDWVIPGFNAAGEITVWAGLPAVGKTTGNAALTMLVAGFGSAIGSDVLNDRPRPVVIVSECASQYERIFCAVCDRYGIDPGLLADRVHIYDAQRLHRGELGMELLELVRRHTRDEPILLILDTASAMFDLSDENSNAEVAAMIAEIKLHVMPTESAVWIIAHAAKPVSRTDSEAMPRGASAYIGDAHATGAVFRDEGTPGTTFFKSLKFRHERAFDEVAVDTFTHKLTGTDSRGIQTALSVRLGVPMRSSADVRAQRAQVARSITDQQRAGIDNLKAQQVLTDLLATNGAVAVSRGAGAPRAPKALGSVKVLSIRVLQDLMGVRRERAVDALRALRDGGTYDEEHGDWVVWRPIDANGTAAPDV